MTDAELAKSIKQTQELLGKYVKKPPLSEKNLSRPPFRFLHDVTTSVISSTGFMNGVFGPDELDSNNISSREAKTEFMRKFVTAVNEATGEDVPVKISKVLSGQEPEKTNLLLQSLARAIEKARNPSKNSKATAPSKTKSNETIKGGATTKPTSDKKPETKTTTTKSDGGKGVVSLSKRGVPAVGTNSKKPTAVTPNKKQEAVAGTSRSGAKQQERRKSVTEITTDLKKEDTTLPSKSGETTRGSSSSLKRQNSSLSKLALSNEETLDSGVNNNLIKEGNQNEINESRGDVLGTESNMHDDNPTKLSIVNPNLETLQLPASPVVSDASAIKFGFSSSSISDQDIKTNQDTIIPSVGYNKKDTAIDFRNNQGEPDNDVGCDDEMNADGSNSSHNNRNRTGSNRMRPPSARPAPPRPKSSLFRDNTEESNYRPPTGKVTNVLLDNSDLDEDDNFVVREATVAHDPGLGGVDETPELALATGTKLDVESALEELAPGDRGLLVDQILETQKQIDNRDGGAKDLGSEFGVGKSRETSKAEIEKLKNLLQECARNANPLGKLLDYVREDIDAMQKEVAKYREENRALDSDLEAAKRVAEASLQPIQQQLTDVEARVADKEDAIAATKMSVIRLQERIEKILSGLDRVQSSHGKIVIPSASEIIIMQNETATPRVFSSGFGPTLNRLAASTPGMRPINLFASTTADDDLDPDNFDPFK